MSLTPYFILFAQFMLVVWYFTKADIIYEEYRLSVKQTTSYVILCQFYVFNLIMLLLAFPLWQKYMIVAFVILHSIGSCFRLFGFK